MRPKPRWLRWTGLRLRVHPQLYVFSPRWVTDRRPCSCLKPTLATCKWSAMRCEISTGHPDAFFRPLPFAVGRHVSLQLHLCECAVVSERGGKAYICVRMSTDAACLSIRLQAGWVLCSSLHPMDRLTERSQSELCSRVCAMLH